MGQVNCGAVEGARHAAAHRRAWSGLKLERDQEKRSPIFPKIMLHQGN
jgi:hypothetical protein